MHSSSSLPPLLCGQPNRNIPTAARKQPWEVYFASFRDGKGMFCWMNCKHVEKGTKVAIRLAWLGPILFQLESSCCSKKKRREKEGNFFGIFFLFQRNSFLSRFPNPFSGDVWWRATRDDTRPRSRSLEPKVKKRDERESSELDLSPYPLLFQQRRV